jgi:hypothetical protein
LDLSEVELVEEKFVSFRFALTVELDAVGDGDDVTELGFAFGERAREFDSLNLHDRLATGD